MRDNLIVKHLAGSRAYGTDLPSSDTDIRGLFIGDPINIRTPWYTIKEGEITDSEDAKLYEFHHFFKLYVDQNPNIMETLWVDEGDIIEASPIYWFLRKQRENLMSTKIAHSYTGYAMGQLHRMAGHNKWINNPQPADPPQQAEFVTLVQNFQTSKLLKRDFSLRGFHEDWRLIPYGNHIYGLYGFDRPIPGYSDFTTRGYKTFNKYDGTLNTVVDENLDRSALPVPAMIVKFNFQEYKKAHQNWEQYWEWKRKRNPERAALEEKFGYDTKHAMHLFRLMRTGQEALMTGQIHVRRPDAAELLDIRHGKYTYEEVLEYARKMDHQIRKVDYHNSVLPKKLDLKFAAKLVLDVQDLAWKE